MSAGLPGVACADSLLPAGWDPALAGDEVMERLVAVTAPEVKGAHDAEMAIVDGKAYVVAEVNDVRAGESAGWPEIYATLSIVRLDPLKLETVIPVARSGQRFANGTLPVGACFVPRILQKDSGTLRCYFTSEDPGKRQSQLWYRDFDLKTAQFADTIHRAKLMTAAGTFDFQPQYFHADAASQGFTKPAKDSSFFLFDSFKRFDDGLYVALNNFGGKQNALARVQDDLATFEVLGHYNEPQSQQLSESSVNRLPDGTWMAICRNDAGNYHFTTSADGRTWSEGREMPFVSNGANSKPTFDQFGDLYYLGWQEATRIHGVSRSVFNVEISRDGKRWERKYRFESVKSFQYPTFREHGGDIWLCVTQGDRSPSRKERIMFGRLEKIGAFESQAGRVRKPIPEPPMEEAVMKPGVKLFTDRDYTLDQAPAIVMGRPFLRTSIEATDVRVTQPGTLYALTPTVRPKAASQEAAIRKAGFARMEVPETQFFPGEINRVSLYRKEVAKGERLRFRKLVFLVMGDGVVIEEVRPEPPKPWTENDGERLYNGIVLPKVWPPDHLTPGSAEPMPVPYLDHPPRIIPIDLGRQLFVDDFLIESTDLKRVFHRPEKFAGNPVFKAETETELSPSTEGERGEEATTFTGQGGLFFDPAEKVFKLFYVAGWRGPLSLATSPDLTTWTRHGELLPQGLKWTGPPLRTGGSDNCVWLDLSAADPAERIKFLTCWMHVKAEDRPKGFNHTLHVSDGQRWSDGVPTTMAADDYCSFFHNPFRSKWCFSIKRGTSRGRSRYYLESDRFLSGANWSDAVFWTNTDRLDLPEPASRYPGAGDTPQLYSLNAVAYESLMVGMHYIHRGPKNEICDAGQFPKLVDLEIGFSRDGFHWDRPDRSGFISGSRVEGSWDRGYLHSTAGVFAVLNDRLVFPYMGTSGMAPSGKRGMYTGGAIGLASLRRDGFASMEGAGQLTTRPVSFQGRHGFVNLDGELRVELLDETGKVLAKSRTMSGDSTRQRIEWEERGDLSEFAGQPVRFRFQLGRGALYSFWVTEDPRGSSGGYLGAGGPGFDGVRDLPAAR
ncbi:MAG: exo-alpha-sialidase [Akkermansiaceae bacterium]|nr:exo-alpha-sialidase [Akkermansiaceae bacterium]